MPELKSKGFLSAARLIWDGALDLIYPPRCFICERDGSESFCTLCRQQIVPLHAPFCDRCGMPIAADRLVCPDCESGSEPEFNWSLAAGAYTGVLRTAIHKLKFDGKVAIAQPLGELLADAVAAPSPARINPADFDCIVPVPLHPGRRHERGFNQAERIARPISARYGTHLDTVGLRRARRTRSQTNFNRVERARNVAGVFETRTPLYFDGQSVMLIDDVLTTGSTLNECAKVIKNAGAKRVVVAAVARGS